MRKSICLSTVAVALTIVAPSAFALAQRTFVASYGNDANPCSLASPCRAFAAAIAQTITGGEVIVKDSAGYGVVTVTKSVSLVAPAGLYGGITVSGVNNGITVNAPGAKVLLRGLTINGGGSGQAGVLLQSGAELTIDRCVIENMGATGVLVAAAGSALTITDSVVRGTAGPGVRLQSDARVALQRVRLLRNGGALGNGVRAEAGNVSIAHSVIAGNGQNGVFVIAGSGLHSAVAIDDSIVSDNTGDGVRVTSAVVAGSVGAASVTRTSVARNATGLNSGTNSPGSSVVSAARNLISHSSEGVFVNGTGAVASARENTFARNANAALSAPNGTLRTVRGADGLPSNAGEVTTQTSGTITPVSPF